MKTRAPSGAASDHSMMPLEASKPPRLHWRSTGSNSIRLSWRLRKTAKRPVRAREPARPRQMQLALIDETCSGVVGCAHLDWDSSRGLPKSPISLIGDIGVEAEIRRPDSGAVSLSLYHS